MIQLDTGKNLINSSFSPNLAQLGGVLSEAALLAKITKQSSDYRVDVKQDGSFVTTVDLQVHAFLTQRLPEVVQGVVISEEGYPQFSSRRDAECYWIIDPIDNTQGLVETGIEESCINVALFRNGTPLAAAIHYFSDESTYFGTQETGVLVKRGSEISVIQSRCAGTPTRLVAYKPTLDTMSATMQEALGPYVNQGAVIVHRDKLPLRLRALLDGKADVYIDPREINEWDVAAGMVLGQFLGAKLSTLDSGEPITFNTPRLKCRPFNLQFPASPT